jgi:NAD(P)H-dependent flavin oxidoreductase YrpB (nitropropane dioxygenase family)
MRVLIVAEGFEAGGHNGRDDNFHLNSDGKRAKFLLYSRQVVLQTDVVCLQQWH